MITDVDVFQDTIDLSYEEAREQKENLEKLVLSKGWEFISDFLVTRGRGLKAQLVAMPVKSQEDVAAFNSMQGRIQELELFPRMIESLFTDLKLQVQNYQEEFAAQENSE